MSDKSDMIREELQADRVYVREAVPEDAARLLEIYAYYVEKTAITFDYEVPSLEEFRARIGRIKERYPYLVIIRDGVIEGYAYAGVFKDRARFQGQGGLRPVLRDDHLP